MIIFTINNYIGPDIVIIIGKIIELITGNESYGDLFIETFHDPFMFIIIALILAIIYTFLTKLGIRRGGILGIEFYILKGRTLKYFDCFQIILAGGFSHFFLDNLFHPNTNWYVWVMSTGDWIKYDNPSLMIPILGTIAIGFGWVFLYIISFSSVVKNSKYNKVRYKILIIIGFTISISLYIIYFMIFGPTHSGYPAVGEEADLGIFVFISIFLILPIILCINSYEHFGNNISIIRKLYSL